MAQGKKYNDDIKEKAFALLVCNNSVADVARKLDLPYSTVQTWLNKYIAQSEKLARQEKDGDHNYEHDLVKLRQQKKEEFIRNAWRTIGKAHTLIEKRIDRAIENPDDPECEINVRELSTVLGTLYDKQALACKDATSIVEANATVRFEDL